MLSDPRADGLRRHASGPLDQGAVVQTLLPAHAYTDPSWFAAEQRSIFGDGWVWAGYEHWVRDVGDVHPITVAGEPLVLVRGAQGVQVFYNVCRHRGFLLCDTPHSVARIRCPYHGWTYALDGSLQATPYWDGSPQSGPDDPTRDTLHLLVAKCATWAGMVFVHLGEAGRPFAEALAPLRQAWTQLDLSRLAHAETRRYEVNANWKLVVENFLDFYHLPFVHPQVGSTGAALDVDDVVLDEQIIGGRYPRGATGKAAKSDRPLPTFGDVPAELRDRQDIFCVFPNALLFMEADWFQVIGFEPIAPDQTIEHMAVFVDRDAIGDDFAAARGSLTTALFGVNDQDVPVLERLQVGRHSSTAGRGNLVTHWDQIGARFQLLVRQALEVPLASPHNEDD
jgi:choline monooxygenase